MDQRRDRVDKMDSSLGCLTHDHDGRLLSATKKVRGAIANTVLAANPAATAAQATHAGSAFGDAQRPTTCPLTRRHIAL